MKYKLTYFIIFFIYQNLFTQGSFQTSGNCQRDKNINCTLAQTSNLNKDNVRATFRFAPLNYPSKGVSGYSLCTGTMLNQFYDAGGIIIGCFLQRINL